MLCELAVDILKSAGHDAICFCCPNEYLDYLFSDNYNPPTAIFTDIVMPELNGHQLINKIKEVNPTQKIVIVSGFDQHLDPKDSQVCHVIQKPYLPQTIIDIANAARKCGEEDNVAASATCDISQASTNSPEWKCPLDCFNCEGKKK